LGRFNVQNFVKHLFCTIVPRRQSAQVVQHCLMSCAAMQYRVLYLVSGISGLSSSSFNEPMSYCWGSAGRFPACKWAFQQNIRKVEEEIWILSIFANV